MFSFMDVLLSFSEVSKKYFVSWNCSVCSFMGFVLYFVPRLKLFNYWVKVLIFIGNLSVIFLSLVEKYFQFPFLKEVCYPEGQLD